MPAASCQCNSAFQESAVGEADQGGSFALQPPSHPVVLSKAVDISYAASNFNGLNVSNVANDLKYMGLMLTS